MCKIINLADVSSDRNKEVVLNTIAKKLNSTKNLVAEAQLHVTAKLMADVKDGYILYDYNGEQRAALVININIGTGKFPFVYHSDDGTVEPVSLLFNDQPFEYLGTFEDYICNGDNYLMYHTIADYIPRKFNGIGIIQAMHMAKCKGVSINDELSIRRIAREAVSLICNS